MNECVKVPVVCFFDTVACRAICQINCAQAICVFCIHHVILDVYRCLWTQLAMKQPLEGRANRIVVTCHMLGDV